MFILFLSLKNIANFYCFFSKTKVWLVRLSVCGELAVMSYVKILFMSVILHLFPEGISFSSDWSVFVDGYLWEKFISSRFGHILGTNLENQCSYGHSLAFFFSILVFYPSKLDEL